MRKLLPAFLVLLPAACATATHWEKAGVSEAQMADDLVACRLEARQAPEPSLRISNLPGSTTSNVIERQEDLVQRESQRAHECMVKRGYQLQR